MAYEKQSDRIEPFQVSRHRSNINKFIRSPCFENNCKHFENTKHKSGTIAENSVRNQRSLRTTLTNTDALNNASSLQS